MINFLHTYLPNAVLVDLGFARIYWYGFLIVIGIILGLWVVIRLGRRYGLSSDDILELALYLIIFSLIGARIYHIFLEWQYYLSSPLAVFKVWQGGLAIHGGLISGIIVLYFWAKKKKLSFWLLSDLLAPALILGQAIGRWGNYFNQEIYGYPTSLPWGIPIAPVNRPSQYLSQEFFHPTFLYESLADLLVFIILIFGHRYCLKKKKEPKGTIFFLYLILYSIIRITTEFWRIDRTVVIGPLRWPQIISMFIIIITIVIWQKRLTKT